MIVTSLRRFGGRFQAGGRVVLETQTDRTEHGRLRPTAKSTVGYDRPPRARSVTSLALLVKGVHTPVEIELQSNRISSRRNFRLL